MKSRHLALGFLLGALAAWMLLRRQPGGQEAWPVAKPAPTPAAAPAPAGRLAFVIDDWGYHSRLLPRLKRLPGRVTVAVLPGLAHSRACAQAAHDAGHEVILHLPVEPEGEIPLVPGTLKVGMPEAEAQALCERHAASVPFMAGLNNHEGSKGSADPALMGAVARWLKGRGGYFLDSLTTPRSVIRQAAQKAGVPYARRRIFLDNVDSPQAVRQAAEQALAMALKEGSCIAIGHPRVNTLDALEAVGSQARTRGVELVPVSELLR